MGTRACCWLLGLLSLQQLRPFQLFPLAHMESPPSALTVLTVLSGSTDGSGQGRGFGSQPGLLCAGASRWQQRFAAPGSPSRSLNISGCTVPAKSPLLCYCSSLSCVGRAALRAAVRSGAQSQELQALHPALKPISPSQRREQQAGGSVGGGLRLDLCPGTLSFPAV